MGQICTLSEINLQFFSREGLYDLDFKNPNSSKASWLTPQQLADVYTGFVNEFPIVSIEDPFDQDDWEAWSAFTKCVDIQVRWPYFTKLNNS